MHTHPDSIGYCPVAEAASRYGLPEEKILKHAGLFEEHNGTKTVSLDKLGLATLLSYYTLLDIGFKVSPLIIDFMNEWHIQKKGEILPAPIGTVTLYHAYEFWTDCLNNESLQMDQITGRVLQKNHLDYSKNGNAAEVYSSDSVKGELESNLRTVQQLILRYLEGRGEGIQKLSIHQSTSKLAELTGEMYSNSGLSIDSIWEQFHRTHEDYFRNLLMEHYRTLVKYCAERLHSKLPDKVELDDLVSAGIFGLIDAIDAFDPERGVKFETYCSPRIKGSILDEMREMDWVPRLVRARSHQLAKATKSLEILLGRSPTEKEIAKELNMDRDEYNRLRRDANAVGLISLDTKYGDDNGEKNIREIDTITDPNGVDPVAEAQKKDLLYLLTKGITRAERLIIVLYYYEDMNMKEIGQTLDLSESRVSQMHSSIIAMLKAKMYDRKDEMLGRERTTKPAESAALEYTPLSNIVTQEAGKKNYKVVMNWITNNPDSMELTERARYGEGRKVHSGNTEKLRRKIRTYLKVNTD